jgi:hypothetical protein
MLDYMHFGIARDTVRIFDSRLYLVADNIRAMITRGDESRTETGQRQQPALWLRQAMFHFPELSNLSPKLD